jgi:hypothetical protein
MYRNRDSVKRARSRLRRSAADMELAVVVGRAYTSARGLRIAAARPGTIMSWPKSFPGISPSTKWISPVAKTALAM